MPSQSLETDVGVPVFWQFSKRPQSCGPLLLRDFRTRPPTIINALQAVYAEIYRRDLWRPRAIAALCAVAWGGLLVVKRICRWLGRRGTAARRSYGRSFGAQARDMVRAWAAADLRPSDYYAGQLARHGGGPDLFAYVTWPQYRLIVIELQRATFGAPAIAITDKAAFARWCAANGVRTPRQFALDPGAPAPSTEVLNALGDQLIVKPRASMEGHGIERWTCRANGYWRNGDRIYQPRDFARLLARSASNEWGGIVVQERLRNHPDLIELCGEVLSTCRVVTLLNERNDPEVVQLLWRMNLHPAAVVNNFSMGGMYWTGSDMDTGAVEFGVDDTTETGQAPLHHHPITGRTMVGARHPFYPLIRDFAVAGHRKLGSALVLGWDVAMTAAGPTVLEVNFPTGLDARVQMVWNGIAHARYGEILAFRARRWLEENVDPGGRRALGSRWNREGVTTMAGSA